MKLLKATQSDINMKLKETLSIIPPYNDEYINDGQLCDQSKRRTFKERILAGVSKSSGNYRRSVV